MGYGEWAVGGGRCGVKVGVGREGGGGLGSFCLTHVSPTFHPAPNEKKKKTRECRFEAQIWLKKLRPSSILGTQTSWCQFLPTKRKEMTT